MTQSYNINSVQVIGVFTSLLSGDIRFLDFRPLQLKSCKPSEHQQTTSWIKSPIYVLYGDNDTDFKMSVYWCPAFWMLNAM